MIFRVNKNKDYTVISNYHLKDKRLSLKAKGLLSLMFSLPDDWDYSINGLVALSKDGKDSVMNTLTEIEKAGYLTRTRAVDSKGRFAGYDYNIFEKPDAEKPYPGNPNTEKPDAEKPYPGNPNTEKPDAEKPNSENPPQLNTKELNTNGLSTKQQNTKQQEKLGAKAPSKKDEPTYYPDVLLNAAFLDFIEMRKKIKKPMTDRAIELCMRKLKELSTQPFSESMDNDIAIKILEQSTMNCWQGLFPLRENRQGNYGAKRDLMKELCEV